MLYYLGIVFIILFNIAVLYDLKQQGEEIYNSNFLLFLCVVVFFCLAELLFFTLIYFFIINLIGFMT